MVGCQRLFDCPRSAESTALFSYELKSVDMETQKLQNKIDGLRNLTIQNGCTREEATTARTLLTTLQTKLNLARKAQALADYVTTIQYTPTEADQILQEIRKQAQDKARYEARHPNAWGRIKTWITSK